VSGLENGEHVFSKNQKKKDGTLLGGTTINDRPKHSVLTVHN
jgi:hypothetical protein